MFQGISYRWVICTVCIYIQREFADSTLNVHCIHIYYIYRDRQRSDRQYIGARTQYVGRRTLLFRREFVRVSQRFWSFGGILGDKKPFKKGVTQHGSVYQILNMSVITRHHIYIHIYMCTIYICLVGNNHTKSGPLFTVYTTV